jgi:hypothetical protein
MRYSGMRVGKSGWSLQPLLSACWAATPVADKSKQPRDGSSVILCIDASIQGFLEKCARSKVDPKTLIVNQQADPLRQGVAQMLGHGVRGGIPGALTAGKGHRLAGAGAGTLASGVTEEAGGVALQALLPKLRHLATVHPELAENLLNILNLTKTVGGIAAGAGAGHFVGRYMPEEGEE